MATWSVRVSNEIDAYARRLAEGAGLSLAATVETLMDEARRRGWTVEPRRGAVVEPEPES